MPDLSPGSVVAGHRIEAVAGRGGMGIVYRAFDLSLERAAALKVIAPALSEDQSFRERFKRESRIAASIRHPNVIPIHSAGEEDGLLYITMDYVEGTDLRALVESEGRIPPARAAAIVTQVAAALDAAHARGLVHRDVKPANVLIEAPDGHEHCYLTDFGLTKSTASMSGITGTGMFVGTIDYMAPEQLQGSPVDARTDVYSLGCVLYETLTGEVPYPRPTDAAKMWAHMTEEPPRVLEAAPDLPRQLEQVVARALAKDPEARFQSAGDLADAATSATTGRAATTVRGSVAAGEAAPAQAPPPPQQPTVRATPPLPATPQPAPAAATPAPRRPHRRRLALAAGLGALAVGAVMVALVLSGGDDDEGPAAPALGAGDVAAVADEAIPETELDHWRRVLGNLSDSEGTDARQQAMRFLITSRWLEQEAAERGTDVSDQEVRDAFDAGRQERFDHERAFREYLRESGQTRNDVLFRTRLDLLARKLGDEASPNALERQTNPIRAKWRPRTRCRAGFAVSECFDGNGQ